ncbi:MAG TPA: hypothetical protein VNO82_05445 [Solirubrobacteraceae bacterium]|nr:hypothetical protein [Solirubrobacteraceae bacterium]
MRTVSAERVAAALIAAAALVGCGSEADTPASEPAPRGPATVDEQAGTYRGVGIGSTREEARRELGRVESGPTDPLTPIGTDALEVGVPPAPRDPRDAGGIAIWRFEDAVMAAGRGRAWLVAAAADDAVTTKGVGVGSALGDIRAAYPDAECATANAGGEYVKFEFCTLRVAPDRYLYFGYDPVRSVTMSRMPLR